MIGEGANEGVLARLAALEARVRELEDHAAICQLIARYGPAVDGMRRAALRAMWTPHGTYETEHHVFRGADEVGAIVDDPMHLGFVEPGCAHVMSHPVVTLQGDTAVATNYSRVYQRHGTTWAVVRAAANRWELVRASDGGWRVERRVNRLLNGSELARSLLANGLEANA
ncbi:nuclear transport factor 2 family protein [Novosphingobium cyanobacteriorum]|uniref:Nuclear transport factor 2 family protein n=1 Tax=Novosphingobium cyanobacteriorum TaxID=3024215 RepID=A0ABT6CM13_9SPHN|nr:nuclear transport factor 2 family protein [Novosphingobium cyanobacteriorum]MDF8334955.1 nuclear transport factor 2 family protein [Novosphingobium cyanobacteriorum]